MNTKEIYEQQIYNIIGAAMEVHRHLGCGFLEEVYQEALERELKHREIPFEAQCRIKVYYKDEPLDKYYIADLVCYDDLIIELKAVGELAPIHTSQLVNYLQATNSLYGVLINFGEESLRYRRVINGRIR